MDDFLPPSPDPGEFTVVSQPIPATMTQDAWFAKYLLGGFTNGCFPPRAQWESISITGHPAGLHGGMAQCNFTEAITIVDGRAYIFTASPNKTNLNKARSTIAPCSTRCSRA